MKFSKHLFLFVLVPLLILVVLASYYRFFLTNDYLIGYQGDCDPATSKCYTGCDDEDDCTDVYYYSNVTKRAADIYAECGPDITDCADANVCLPQDVNCSIEYCSDSDECIGPDPSLSDEEDSESVQDSSDATSSDIDEEASSTDGVTDDDSSNE